jgi:hypothetical protein
MSKRVYTPYEKVLHFVVRYHDLNHRYPDTRTISRTFGVGLRSAQKMLKRFYLELGE